MGDNRYQRHHNNDDDLNDCTDDKDNHHDMIMINHGYDNHCDDQ